MTPLDTENIKKSDMDAIIKDVKIEIRKLYGGYKKQIERIGYVLKAKRLINEEDICTEIKNALSDEIKEKIISSDTIERCCPDEWKRKTKPKGLDPQLRIYDDKNPQEQEIVTNVNADVTSRGQILQQEFKPDESKKMEEQKSEGQSKRVQEQVAHLPREQESEELQRLKIENKQLREEIESLRSELNKLKVKEQEGDIWTANAIVWLNKKTTMPIIVTVNTLEKKIESAKFDREAIKKATRDYLRQRREAMDK